MQERGERGWRRRGVTPPPCEISDEVSYRLHVQSGGRAHVRGRTDERKVEVRWRGEEGLLLWEFVLEENRSSLFRERNL